MTKQKEIRKVIDAYRDDDCLYPDKDCEFCRGHYCISDEDAYKCLMERLDELGVVLGVDRELPYSRYANAMFNSGAKSQIKENMEKNSIYEEAQLDMRKAGCGFFEPLIKEE